MINKNKNSKKNFKVEDKFRIIFENAGDAIFIHDLEGNFLEVNEMACRRLGYTKEELLKMGPADIDAPEFSVKIKKRIKELQKKGEVVFETEHVTKKGNRIPIELSSKVIDYESQKAILSIARDISEDRTLAMMRRRSKVLFDIIPSAVFTVDLNKKITGWNKAAERITGFSAEEMIGEKCSKFALSPCDKDCGLLSKKKKPIHGKGCVVKTKDGKELAISKNVDILIDDKGNMTGGVESFEDITKIKKTEDELQEKLEELEKINEIMVGREKRMIELKSELKKCKKNNS